MTSSAMILAHTAVAAATVCEETETVSSREFKVGEQRRCFNRRDCDESQLMKLLYVWKVIGNTSIQLFEIFADMPISLLLVETRIKSKFKSWTFLDQNSLNIRT